MEGLDLLPPVAPTPARVVEVAAVVPPPVVAVVVPPAVPLAPPVAPPIAGAVPRTILLLALHALI